MLYPKRAEPHLNNRKYVPMMSSRSRIFSFIFAAAMPLWAPDLALAQDFPTKPIRFVVAYPPGGSVDMAARLLANSISPLLGQPIVVENRSGASGIVGTQSMAATPSDGHTFLVAATAVMAIVPHIKKVTFIPERDFVPVARLVDTVSLIAANKKLKANNFDELISQAKQEGRELRYGYVGVGTITHLMGEMIRKETGVKLLSVPYKGNADEINAALSGEIDFIIDPTAMSHVKAGSLKGLAVRAPKRLPDLPNVPTIEEGKLKLPDAPSWISLFALKGTSSKTVDQMAAALERALSEPKIQEALLAGGMISHFQDPAVFARQVTNDSKFYANLIQENHIVLD